MYSLYQKSEIKEKLTEQMAILLASTPEVLLAQSCPTLSDPMDCSPPGSPVHGIFQARILE